jgi:hypothetical protein
MPWKTEGGASPKHNMVWGFHLQEKTIKTTQGHLKWRCLNVCNGGQKYQEGPMPNSIMKLLETEKFHFSKLKTSLLGLFKRDSTSHVGQL